jgi:hypothetical protein
MKARQQSPRQKAIEAINKHHALLVFPINNKKQPLSIWQALYPRSEMRWEWDEGGDNRVASLWHLRAQLSTSREVIYSKWYQGRATFFSKEAFVHLMAATGAHEKRKQLMSHEALSIMEALEMDSPLSTKQIKEVAELQGRSFEAHYNKVMKQLWYHGLILAFGEVEDSSFPSLAVGATSALFEELWEEASQGDSLKSVQWLQKHWGSENLFFKYLEKQRMKPSDLSVFRRESEKLSSKVLNLRSQMKMKNS